MTDNITLDRSELLAKLNSEIHKKLPADQAKLMVDFLSQFFETVALDDLASHELIDLYGAMLSFWSQVYEREPGQTKLRIFNPDFEQHGWQSTHTIIEVIQDDMPFLVDSIQMELNNRGITTHVIFHAGAIRVQRDKNHKITKVYPMGEEVDGCPPEAFIFVEIDRQTDPQVLLDLQKSLTNILNDVRAAVEDWPKMLGKIDEAMKVLEQNPPPVEKDLFHESIDFLHWLANNHFTVLGWREYSLEKETKDLVLKAVPDTGLGVLRGVGSKIVSRRFSDLPPEAKKAALEKGLLILGKTNRKSTVHRPVYTDCIEIKVYDSNGHITGIKRIVGLFTSIAYSSRPYAIPLLRQKVREVMRRSKLSPTGHAGKALLNILENLPRDDLFQSSSDELLELSMGILRLQERRRVSLFIRRDAFGRSASCLLYLPRDHYNTRLREQAQEILLQALGGSEVSFTTYFSESILARIHFLIRVDNHAPIHYDVKELETKMAEIARSWHDDLYDDLIDHFGEEKGTNLYNKYKSAFTAGYMDDFNPRTAVYDIAHIDTISEGNPIAMSLSKPLEATDGQLRLKLFNKNDSLPLSDALPVLENMGLRVLGEQPYCVRTKQECFAWINDFHMLIKGSTEVDIERVKESFQEAFLKVWFGEAENDGFNRLVLLANINWREVTVLRAYSKYLKQIKFTFSQNYIEETFSKYPHIAKELVELFKLRFDPNRQKNSEKNSQLLNEKIEEQLESVENLDEDRILRKYYELIYGTLRTNFFQKDKDGNCKTYLSFKLNPLKISGVPKPLPMFEIFVYSPRVEGVHLRSGKVARGGLRWSDRREDFRTEILGLMKAQRVKNAVIVPTGAKGGFVCKMMPENAGRDEVFEEGVACYKIFISALLDLTDNRKPEGIVSPENTICYDEEDSYFVVAADKGTATFSDYANSVAIDYGFWLGDAFASGGKTGYDHKKMGITARGAWESVKRHFREIGINTQTDEFTVVGIGDLMGDVFGNGMLLSNRIKLLAAFNHLHIFIDPNPNPEQSFLERKRIFELPRSSWEDYNAQLISHGGGIFSRKAKSIKLTPEIKQLFHIEQDFIEPNVLIKEILKSEIDLLWNGGIGTFVKATHETNEQVGDRSNDAIRLNGNELRCRVVGEGGNLGMTQLGRVEYSLNGGRVSTDFIDNSGGVDCSDHEVNIKILLNNIVQNEDMTEKQRNELLSQMTEDVGKLVLRNNYTQTQAISLAKMHALKDVDLYTRIISDYDAAGKLDRAIEFLPDDKQILERKANNLTYTGPELAIVLAYTKIILKEQLLKSNLLQNKHIATMAQTAFPQVLNNKYPQAILAHSLYPEIAATQLSNCVVDYVGITFIKRLQEQTGAAPIDIVKAFFVAKNVFNIDSLWHCVESLDYKINSDSQYEIMHSIARLMRRATRWIIRNNRDFHDMDNMIELYQKPVTELFLGIHDFVQGRAKDVVEETSRSYIEYGVNIQDSQRLAAVRVMLSALDIILISSKYGYTIREVARVYFKLSTDLWLDDFKGLIMDYPEDSHWDALGKAGLRDDLDKLQRDLTISVLFSRHDLSVDSAESVVEWMNLHSSLVQRWQQVITELKSYKSVGYVMLAVAARELQDLTQNGAHVEKELVS